jgi:hypothetical protein
MSEAGVSGTGFSPGSITSGIVVDANGTIWFGYQTGRTSSTNVKYCLNEPTDTDTSHTVTSNLASISTAGVLTTLQTGIDTQTCIANTYPATGVNCTGQNSGGPIVALTPDGNGGALIEFIVTANNNQQVMMQSTSGGSPYPAPLGGGSWVLGENNTAFLTDGSSVASFNPITGSLAWEYASSFGNLSISEATGDGGVRVTDSSGAYQLDYSGNASGPQQTLQSAVPFSLTTWAVISNGVFKALWSPDEANGLQTTIAASQHPKPTGNSQNQGQPPFCQQKGSNCVLVVNTDESSQAAGGPVVRVVTYVLASLNQSNLSRMRRKQEITLHEDLISGSPSKICDNPDCSNKLDFIDTAQFEDTLSVLAGGPFSVWQKYFVERQNLRVFWRGTDGKYYGSLKQRADHTHDAVTITQFEADMSHPATF